MLKSNITLLQLLVRFYVLLTNNDSPENQELANHVTAMDMTPDSVLLVGNGICGIPNSPGMRFTDAAYCAK